jgi:hypothetical protein
LPPEIERLVPKIGDRTSDGTVYAGISPETNAPLFTIGEEVPSALSWHAAAEFAEGLRDVKGRKGFQLPTPSEASVVWNNFMSAGSRKGYQAEELSAHWTSVAGWNTNHLKAPGTATALRDVDGKTVSLPQDSRQQVRPIRYGRLENR